MATATSTPAPPSAGAILFGVPWDMYCRFRDEPANVHTRMTYLDGTLTIMSPRMVHDIDSRLLILVIMAVARAWRIRFLAVGATTLRRVGKSPLHGAAKEPDEGFYLGDVAVGMRIRDDLDLSIDPPPSLAIEVDTKADSEDALPAYARIGVPEVWVYKVHEHARWFGRLDGEDYREIDRSPGLPRLTPALVLEALDARKGQPDDLDWLDWLDAWARRLPDVH